MNYKFEQKKKLKEYFANKKIIVPLLIVFAVVLIGTTYALWQITFTQSGTNVITTGCLKLTLTEDTDAISITDAVPTTDSEGKKLDPFTFTLENVCTTETAYVVNLETVSSGDKILTDNYVKANLVSGSNELFLDNLKETHINEEKVIEEATVAYKLHQGKLGNKEKISFSLRLWMDESTPADDAVMDATWQGKITVTATYIPPKLASNVLKSSSMAHDYCGSMCYISYNVLYSQDFQYPVNKVIFQDTINPYANAEKVIDLSEEQDNSVLGYYIKNDGIYDYNNRNTYTLYIQANGKIKANPNASNYFASYEPSLGGYLEEGIYIKFEGIQNIDFSQVTDMSYILYCYQDENNNIDLIGWDTSQVTNMMGMFSRVYINEDDNGLSNIINITSLNTSKVTNMSHMFQGCDKLTSLDLSNLDTSQVTDMSEMFRECSNLTTTINITNPNVESYTSMFHEAATMEGAQITVNYTEETSDLVDQMIATKSENSNVVKGSLIS